MKQHRASHDMDNIDLPLWEQQLGETNVAYAAFLCYRDMVDERSARAVAKKCGKSVSLISRWCIRWRWTNRVAAWTRHNERATEAAIQKQREAKAKVWAKREEDIRERQWELAEQFMARAKAQLAFPTVQQTKTEEKRDIEGRLVSVTTIIVNPVRADAVADAAMWFRLHSAALGLDERTGGVGMGAGTVAPVPTELQATVVIQLPDNGRQAQGGGNGHERNVTPQQPPQGPALAIAGPGDNGHGNGAQPASPDTKAPEQGKP